MSDKKFFPSAEVYRTIIDRVVEDFDSPYNQLMRKTNDIDVDYFDKINRSQVLDKNLNNELMAKALKDFEKRFDDMLDNGDLEKELLEDVIRKSSIVKENMGDNAYANYLEGLSSELHRYAYVMEFVPRFPKYTDTDLKEKYEAAKRITLREHVMQDNIIDVNDYHSALMDRTWWECRVLVTEHVRTFLLNLSKDIQKLKQL